MQNKKIYYGVPIFILALVIVGFISTQPVNSLTMDVNPSIELVTNRLDRVVEINPLNEDGRELLEGFNPKDKNLENTVNDLVDLMVLTGHIKGGKDNFVMLTVEDDSMDKEIVNKVNKAIAAILENKQMEATVLNQGIIKNQNGEKVTGVELAAQRLSKLDGDLTSNEIGNMTVRELVHYSQENDIPIESLFKVFKVIGGNGENTKRTEEVTSKEKSEEDKVPVEKPKISTNKRITPDRAKKIALDRVGGGKVIDFEDDDKEFEIEILYNGREYEVEVHAYTGEILEFEIEDYKEEDKAPVEKPNKSANKRITPDRAKKIALDMVGGGKIIDFEDDDEEFEIEILYNGREYEVEIHAYTGEILEFEIGD